MPPEKFVIELTSMPMPVSYEIIGVTPGRPGINIVVSIAVIVPPLLMPPEKLDTPLSSMPQPAKLVTGPYVEPPTEMVPALLMPPAKLVTS